MDIFFWRGRWKCGDFLCHSLDFHIFQKVKNLSKSCVTVCHSMQKSETGKEKVSDSYLECTCTAKHWWYFSQGVNCKATTSSDIN